MSDTFGARLRAERERRAISIDTIATQTKIKASLFSQLERDDVSHWPSGIFRRSFIKAYARAVGLDVDATVREFLEHFPDPAGAQAGGTVAPEAPPPVDAAASSPPPTAPRDVPSKALRLTLVETGLPFSGGRLIADARRRWSAAAWDIGSILAISLTMFVVLGGFWRPFGVISLCYYIGGILLLGNSPGVCLFAPKPAAGSDDPPRSRVARHRRPAEVTQLRTGEASLRAARFRADRRIGLPN